MALAFGFVRYLPGLLDTETVLKKYDELTLERVGVATVRSFVADYNAKVPSLPKDIRIRSGQRIPVFSRARFLSLLGEVLKVQGLSNRKAVLLRCICDRNCTLTDDGDNDNFNAAWDRKFIYDHFYGTAVEAHSADGTAVQDDGVPPASS